MREADLPSFLGSVFLRTEAEATKSPLTRDQIVNTAVELLDRDGLDQFSMRKMADALGSVATSALYWRISSKNDLLELAIDEIFSTVIEHPPHRDWREQLTGHCTAAYRMLWDHPWAPQLLASHAGLGPNYQAFTDQLMAVLSAAGFKGAHLDSAISAVLRYLIGSAVTDSAWSAIVRRSGMDERMWATRAAARLGIDSENLEAYLNRTNQSGPEARFSAGLRVILIGLRPRQLS